MSKICFVSYEIHPVTSGGCGVLLYNSARMLLQQGHEIVFLFDMPRDEFKKFDPDTYPDSSHCRAYRVEDLCADIPLPAQNFANIYMWRAYRFHWAAQKVVDLEQPDVIEFFDYCGVAHFALLAKITKLTYQNTLLITRLHNSNQVIDLYQPFNPMTAEYYLNYALEHSALRLAETILFPSAAYLTDYKSHYEPWLGKLVHSQPALLDSPQLRDNGYEKKKILFYGRLFGFKGVDLFVDAAVKLLGGGNYDNLCFVLAGYDPGVAPDQGNSYQTYLLRRIPRRYQGQFEFVGQLSWSELEKLLPQVYCAVFPSYLEAFCYAAHELYATGIPVILNDIPAFRDYFKHKENALLFDGTVTDLARQIKTLWHDKALWEQIKRPYRVVDDPLGDFYEGPFTSTWMRTSSKPDQSFTVLVCVLDDGQSSVNRTLESLKGTDIPTMQIVILAEQSQPTDPASGALWFLGKLYNVTTLDNQPLAAGGLETAETLLILRAGDVVDKDYVTTCLAVLARQPELSFVGSWKRIQRNGSVDLDTFPIDAALELIPFENLPLLSRVVMRTNPGKLLIELFDPRLMQMGEVGYLWDIEVKVGPGVLIPEFLLELNEHNAAAWNATLLSYLVAKDTAPYRKTRLTNYLMTIRTAQDSSMPARENRYSEEIAAIVQAIGTSKMGHIVGQNPFMVKWSKAILRRLRRGVSVGSNDQADK